MPHYLIQVAYNTSGVAGLVKEPQNRVEKVTPAIEALGGRVECGYFAFGESLTDPGDRLDLDQHLGLRERRLDRGPCRRLCGEELREHAVHRLEVPDVGEVHGALQHIL